ncbi:MAG: hypothetical protein Q8K75_10915 [Chlamydiales bacterium]|nr:hypothetical protein [Chlamydiales bacterium]
MDQVIATLNMTVEADSLTVKLKLDISYQLPMQHLALIYARTQCESNDYSNVISYYVS